MAPRVSVIMSTFHEAEAVLSEAVQSVLHQTMSDFELVIVDDNPENRAMKEQLEALARQDPRIRLVFHEENRGPGASFDTGTQAARGKYIARLDADDISLPDRLAVQCAYLDAHGECDILGSNRQDIYDYGRNRGIGTDFSFADEDIEKILPFGMLFVNSSVMMRRQVCEVLRRHRNLPAAEDYDYFLRALSAGFRFHIAEEVLLKYRIRESGVTRSDLAGALACTLYAADLYRQREKRGADTFSRKNMARYLEKYGVNDRRRAEEARRLYLEMLGNWQRRDVSRMLTGGFQSLFCPIVLRTFAREIRFHLLLRRYRPKPERQSAAVFPAWQGIRRLSPSAAGRTPSVPGAAGGTPPATIR